MTQIASNRAKREAGASAPSERTLMLAEVVRENLFAFVVREGMKALDVLLESERERLCGPAHARGRAGGARRWGSTQGKLVMGGRRVSVRRPRVRQEGHEVELSAWEQFASRDPLNERTLEQMALGVSTRGYHRSVEELPTELAADGAGKSAVSERLVESVRSLSAISKAFDTSGAAAHPAPKTNTRSASALGRTGTRIERVLIQHGRSCKAFVRNARAFLHSSVKIRDETCPHFAWKHAMVSGVSAPLERGRHVTDHVATVRKPHRFGDRLEKSRTERRQTEHDAKRQRTVQDALRTRQEQRDEPVKARGPSSDWKPPSNSPRARACRRALLEAVDEPDEQDTPADALCASALSG